MSNSLAFASVTAALALRLQAAVSRDVLGAQVQPGRPDGAGNGVRPPGVNIFLYQVSPSNSYKSDDGPTRRADGSLARRPQAPFELHYLLTCHGDELKYEPDRLLGTIIRAMHSTPVLDRTDIAAATGGAPFSGFPLKSDLATQVERVRFSPVSLTLEELSNLWSVFSQAPYSLSIAYQAAVVLIEGDEIPSARLPVRERGLYGHPMHGPTITCVEAEIGPDAPIVPGTVLAVRGQQLSAERTVVLINGKTYDPGIVTDSLVTIELPRDVRAGMCSLQIVQQLPMGTQALHNAFESNVVPFVSRPSITVESASKTNIRAGIEPLVRTGQSVSLLLNDVSSASAGFVFGGRTVVQDTDAIDWEIANVPPGTYLVRVRVDGAESVLVADLDGQSPTYLQYSAPTLTLP